MWNASRKAQSLHNGGTWLLKRIQQIMPQGLTAEQLVASNWFTGPDLLWQKEPPSRAVKVGEIASSGLELKKAQAHDTREKIS